MIPYGVLALEVFDTLLDYWVRGREDMTARQAHGFKNEDIICEKKGYLTWKQYQERFPEHASVTGSYTAPFDGVDLKRPGGNFHGKPIQIKTIKHGSPVDMGDIFRNAAKEEDFELTIEFYDGIEEETKIPNIVESHTVQVNYEKWKLLFEFDGYSQWRHWIKYKVSNDYAYDEEWKSECDERREEWGEDRIVQPRFKRDHKKQRRIQCSVAYSRVEEFLRKIERRVDKYYTNEDVVDKCLATIDIGVYDLTIEPSAGSGEFYKKIPGNKLGIDIEPAAPKIIKKDYLKCDIESLVEIGKKKVLVIGNPPFGKNGTLAVKFFNHSANFCDTIAFIVPRTFRKDSIQNRLHLNFFLEFEMDIPKKSFHTPSGEKRDVPCVWQVWKKRDKERSKVKKAMKHEDFKFVKTVEEADFMFQRVGGSAGHVHRDFTKPLSAYNLISAPQWVFEIFQKIDWGNTGKFDTAGNPSISKSEMVEKYTQQKRQMEEEEWR